MSHAGAMGLKAKALDRFALGILLLFAIIAAFTFGDYGLGWDDLTHSQYGQLLLNFYASGFSDTRALSFVNLYMYGGGFDMAAALIAKALPFDLFETRRLVGAIVGLAGLFVTWRIARRVGGSVAGLLALALLVTCPLYYGHVFINPKDAPFAVAMIILLAGMARAFEEYPRPSLATVTLFGLGIGLAIGSRILGAIAVIYAIPPIAFLVLHEARATGPLLAIKNLGRFAIALVPALLIGYAIMGLIWPWSVLDPLNPFRAAEYFSHFFEKPWKELFDGALISVPEMPRSYVPLLFFLKLPSIFILLGVLGITGIVVATGTSKAPVRIRAVWLLILTAAVLPIIIAVVTRPAMYNGIRHFVFVVPPLAIVGGLAGAWLIETVTRASRIAAAGMGAIILAGLLSPTLSMVRLHPYQYTHFNMLSGGIRAADERFMLDYWGLAFKQATRELRAKLAERQEAPLTRRRWRIAVCGPHAPAEIELGQDFVITWDPKGADFAMMLGAFYCAELPASVLVEVKRQDVVFARVYDIRGLNITTLFTIAPVN